jgi:HEAT repeat protein
MRFADVVRSRCAILIFAVVFGCQETEIQPGNTSKTKVAESNTPTADEVPAAQDAVADDESAADAESEEPFDTWLDRVSDLEPKGEQADELRKLAVLHPDAEVRKSALEELSDADEGIALSSLITSLEDDDPEVVLTAIEGLESLDDRAAIGPLEKIARDHPDEELRDAALEAIESLE